DIDLAVFTSLDGNPPPEDYEVAGGSLAFDLQIHDIDLMFWLLGGRPVRVECTTKPAACLGGGTDLLVTTVELSSGPVCVLTAKRLNPGGCQVGARLTGSADDLDTTSWQEPGPHLDFLDRYHDAYIAEAEDFLRLLHGEADSLATWSDGARAEDLCASIDALLADATKEMAHAG
ncbi:MAG: hypothetical protein ACJ786_31360, partial [Catenulispora sp.]